MAMATLEAAARKRAVDVSPNHSLRFLSHEVLRRPGRRLSLLLTDHHEFGFLRIYC
ncbi:UNVERIFIED_CONTAM: hypothetical protein PYX00_000910 [Menopon gallinae]|uniref:Uncharacterized protein n=1 Tax=Menopon gallinae TaxID=328185 RepID=A0AAW2IAW5_9NEOP